MIIFWGDVWWIRWYRWGLLWGIYFCIVLQNNDPSSIDQCEISIFQFFTNLFNLRAINVWIYSLTIFKEFIMDYAFHRSPKAKKNFSEVLMWFRHLQSRTTSRNPVLSTMWIGIYNSLFIATYDALQNFFLF